MWVVLVVGVTEELRPHQAEAVEFVLGRPGSLLLCEQGTGKSHIVAGAVERLAADGGDVSALLVVPLANVETTWARLLVRTGVEVHRSWPSFRASRGAARVLLLHYEALQGARAARDLKRIVSYPWTLAVYDESQRIKSRASRASRAAGRLARVEHRVALSGTPIEQAPQDLWAQMRFAAPWVFGARWGDFDSRWLRPCGFMGHDREFRWDLLPEFLEAVGPHVFRVLKSDVLDLPPLEVRVESVRLLGSQRLTYDRVDQGLRVAVGGVEVEADLEITRLVRRQQVVGGFVRLADGRSARVGDAKGRRLRWLLTSVPGPPVVFCKYSEEVEICRRIATETLGGRVGVISGETRKTRVQTIDDLAAGRLTALVCQVKSGGVAIDLQAACSAIFYSCPFSYIDFEQAVSRLHRMNQLRAVLIVLLQAYDTVDTIIHEALLQKRSVSDTVLEPHRRPRMAKPVTTAAAPAAKPQTSAAPAAATPAPVKPTPPPQPPKPKYGVTELAEALGTKPASVRVRLRNLGITKEAGKQYGWENKVDFQEVVAKLKAGKDKTPATAAA